MKPLSILLALGLTAPLLCSGLDLGAINTSLTRADSDSLYSEQYEYTVLSDLSIRRVWEDSKHCVCLDFEVAQDQLIMAQLTYKKPVDKKLALADAKAMLPKGAQWGKWKKANPEQTDPLGLNDCFYQKMGDHQYFFIELNDAGKAQCLIYYSTTPRANRRQLEQAQTEAFTAMGSNPNASAALVLHEDESERWEYRQREAQRRNNPSPITSAPSTASATKPASTPDLAAARPAQSDRREQRAQKPRIKVPLTSGVVTPPKKTPPQADKTLNLEISPEKIAITAAIVFLLILLICKLSPKKEPVRKMSSLNGVRRLR